METQSMNGPPLPTTLTAIRSHRLEQNPTYLGPGVSGAVLFSVRSEAQKAIRLPRQTNYSRFEVKDVRNSICILDCSSSFTLVRHIYLKVKPIANSTSKSTGEKNTKTGGSDPTFSAFSRPKSFRGRSRPFFTPGNKAQQPEALRIAPRFGGSSAKHDDLTEFRTKACMAGPQKGEPKKCQS